LIGPLLGGGGWVKVKGRETWKAGSEYEDREKGSQRTEVGPLTTRNASDIWRRGPRGNDEGEEVKTGKEGEEAQPGTEAVPDEKEPTHVRLSRGRGCTG